MAKEKFKPYDTMTKEEQLAFVEAVIVGMYRNFEARKHTVKFADGSTKTFLKLIV